MNLDTHLFISQLHAFSHSLSCSVEQEEREEQATCDPAGFSKFPYLGRENSERLLLREGAITSLPRSLCDRAGAKNVILVVGDGMGWEMARAGAIAKRVVSELRTLGCSITTGCPGNAAILNTFAGRTLSNYYTEGMAIVGCILYSE